MKFVFCNALKNMSIYISPITKTIKIQCDIRIHYLIKYYINVKIAYVDIDILFLVFAQTFRVVLILVRKANMHRQFCASEGSYWHVVDSHVYDTSRLLILLVIGNNIEQRIILKKLNLCCSLISTFWVSWKIKLWSLFL